MVAAGIAAGHRPQVVFLREEAADELGERLGLTGEGAAVPDGAAAPPPAAPAAAGPPPAVFVVSDRVAAHISTLATAADAMAVFSLPERQPPSSLLGSGGLSAADLLVVYVDGVQDPGNLGTLVRAAVAFGAAALVTSAGCADLYGPKTVRASMGALFGLRLFPEVSLAEALDQLPAGEVYGLSARDGTPLPAAALRRPAVLAVGAERGGLSRAVRAQVTELLTIPLAPAVAGTVESLNAGVAGAIALYEFSRRSAGASDDPPRPSTAPAKG